MNNMDHPPTCHHGAIIGDCNICAADYRKSIFDEDYYLRGVESGKSLYTNYRWLPELTIPMVKVMCYHLNLKAKHSVMDFGCARGYVVRALVECGIIRAFGADISEWAVENADETIRDAVVYTDALRVMYDWVMAKDVLEHILPVHATIDNLMKHAKRGVFAVVPLGDGNGRYVCDAYEKDVTHIHRLTLPEWVAMFVRPGWSVEARYRIQGVKDNWHKTEWELGNGFITARRT